MMDRLAALALALQKSGSAEDRSAEILQMLDDSAGDLDGEICYRPWYVAAKALEQDLDLQAIAAADDVKFTRQIVPIRSLLEWQWAIDLKTGAKIPPSFQAAIALKSLGVTLMPHPGISIV